MEDKYGKTIVNRDTCVHCDEFRHCRYKLFVGKPSDCPKDDRKKNPSTPN